MQIMHQSEGLTVIKYLTDLLFKKLWPLHAILNKLWLKSLIADLLGKLYQSIEAISNIYEMLLMFMLVFW